MFNDPKILLSLAISAAAIPAAIWLYLTIKKGPSSKKIALMVFGFGCTTAPLLLGLQIIWEGKTALVLTLIPILVLIIIIAESYVKKIISGILLTGIIVINYFSELQTNSIVQWIWSEKVPAFDLQSAIDKNASSYLISTVLSLLLFVVMEENIKLYVMRTIDRKTLYISKINDAIIYSVAAAIGFSFAENIYYFYSYWPDIYKHSPDYMKEIIIMIILRTIFTTAAHMTYSGVFGYYYGIGKFSMVINQQNAIEGKKDRISKFIAKIFNLPPSEGFRQKAVLKGLFFAMTMHFSINFMLQLQEDFGIQILLPAVVLTTIAIFSFLQYLLNRKAGHLILLTDPTTKRTSTIGKKDEDVVLELMTMWLKDQKYVDVIHICERLLERDPDNNVVKMFKAKAMDEMDDKNIYKQVLGTVIKGKNDLSTSDKSIIAKYVSQKEAQKKTETPKSTETATIKPIENKTPTKVLEKFTGEGTFKL